MKTENITSRFWVDAIGVGQGIQTSLLVCVLALLMAFFCFPAAPTARAGNNTGATNWVKTDWSVRAAQERDRPDMILNYVTITNLTRSRIQGTNFITLRWETTNAIGSLQYEVQMRTSPGGAWTNVTGAVAGNFATFPAPTEERVPFFFRIHCLSATGQEIVDTIAPTTQTNVNARVLSCSSVEVCWSPSFDWGGSGIASYGIYVFTPPNSSVLLGTVTNTETRAIIRNLQPSKSYSFSVRATDRANHTSDRGVLFTTNTPPCNTAPPTIPTGLQVVSLNSTQLFLWWNPSAAQEINYSQTAIRGYQVFRDNALLADFIIDDSALSSVSPRYLDSGLAPETPHCYSIVAIDTLGIASARSSDVCGTSRQPCFSISSLSTTAFLTNGGDGTLVIESAGACGWSAVSAADWITLIGSASGNGNGAVNFRVEPSVSGRRGVIRFGEQGFIITQGAIAPPPPFLSPFSIAPSSISLGAAATNGTISVTDSDARRWTATTTNNWITLGGDINSTRNGTVTYSVAANAASASRNGAILIGGQQFLITQSGKVSGDSLLVGILPGIGRAMAIEVVGNYAYIANSFFGLSVVDISNPETPQVVGVSPIPFDGFSLAVVSNNIVCASGTRTTLVNGAPSSVEGFYIFDVSRPASITVLSSNESGSASYPRLVAAGSNCVYSAAGDLGLQIIDLSNPSSPRLTNYFIPGGAYSIAVSGANAFVTCGADGLRIVNISNPLAPSLIGQVPRVSYYFNQVAAAGDWVYVNDTLAVYAIDVSHPQAPQRKAPYTLTYPYNRVQSMKARNSLIYLTCSTWGSSVLSNYSGTLSTLSSTAEPGATVSSSALDVAVSGSDAYIAAFEGKMYVLNDANTPSPTLGANLDESFEGRGIAAIDGMVVLSGVKYSSGGSQVAAAIRVVDSGHPEQPMPQGEITFSQFDFGGLALSGKNAFVAAGSGGLVVVDLSIPSRPFLANSVGTAGYAKSVTVKGTTAYVANGASGLAILDISIPSVPRLLKNIDTPGYASDVVVVGDYAYLADYSSIQVINLITGRTNGSIKLPNPLSPQKLALDGTNSTFLYAACGSGGLAVLDISGINAISPKWVSPSLPPDGFGSSVSASTLGLVVQGGRAYLANYKAGVGVLDVSMATAPMKLKAPSIPGTAFGMASDGQHIYVLDDASGLDILSR